MAVGICKFCKLERQFARAHIIPKSFHARSDIGPLHIYSNKSGRRPTRSQTGIYDEEMMCIGCEAKYAYLDGYAARILKPWPRRSQLIKDDAGFILKIPGPQSPGGYWLHAIDADRLKLFFCFLMLRCAKSSREEYRISLSEEILARLETAMKNNDADVADIYVIGSRYLDRRNTGTFSPWPRAPKKGAPINFVMLGLRFLVHFEVPPELPELSLTRGKSWPIIFDEFKGSKLHDVAMRMVSKFPSPWAQLRFGNQAAQSRR
jgi:hypothetical protein